MENRPRLYVIQEPDAPAERKVAHLGGIRSRGPARPSAVGRLWPRLVASRGVSRRAKARGHGYARKTD